jgi:hypothetical protein
VNPESFNKVLNRLDSLEARIQKIEAGASLKTGPDLPSFENSKETNLIRKKTMGLRNSLNKNIAEENKSHFLGYVGAACILMAAILLIKLSIDSGWLTPYRQCTFALILSIVLIIFPFLNWFSDKSYISLLPAIGIAGLHLTTYGAVFFHKLLDPTLGIFSISLIGILSLGMLVKLKEENYAIFAILGTYLGAFFFHQSFSQLLYMVIYLLIWDVAFTIFSIKLKNRLIIAICAYLALGLVSFFGGIKGLSNVDLNFNILMIQFFQFTIFALGTVLFSIKNKMPLTSKEAWTFFPLILFFYGQQYYFINRLSDVWANYFSIGFSVFLLFIHSVAKKKLKDNTVDSGGVVYTACSLFFLHSVFILTMNDFSRLIFSFFVILILMFFQHILANDKKFRGTLAVMAFIIIYAYSSILLGTNHISYEWGLFFGFVFALIGLIFSMSKDHSKSNVVLNLAHAQAFVSIFRLKQYFGYFAIAPLWISYAFSILFWAFKKRDIEMANSAIPLVALGVARFLFFDFSKLDGREQIISLLVMGSLIFAGGYLYRKIKRA